GQARISSSSASKLATNSSCPDFGGRRLSCTRSSHTASVGKARNHGAAATPTAAILAPTTARLGATTRLGAATRMGPTARLGTTTAARSDSGRWASAAVLPGPIRLPRWTARLARPARVPAAPRQEERGQGGRHRARGRGRPGGPVRRGWTLGVLPRRVRRQRPDRGGGGLLRRGPAGRLREDDR